MFFVTQKQNFFCVSYLKSFDNVILVSSSGGEKVHYCNLSAGVDRLVSPPPQE